MNMEDGYQSSDGESRYLSTGGDAASVDGGTSHYEDWIQHGAKQRPEAIKEENVC